MLYHNRTQAAKYLIRWLCIILGFPTSFLYAQCPNFSVPAGPLCAGDACDTNPASFPYTGTNTPGNTYQWNFGDPSTQADTSSKKDASYLCTNPGSYTV